MTLDELTQPVWGDTADYFRDRDKRYGTFKWKVPAIVKPQTDDDAAEPAPTTCGEPVECLDIVPGMSRMPQGSSQPGSSPSGLSSGKAQSDRDVASHAPGPEPDSSLIPNAKPVERISCYPCIMPPQLITI